MALSGMAHCVRAHVPKAAALLLLLLAACGPPVPEPPSARARTLSPYWRLLLPEGGGPHPAVLLLSGCDGPHDNMDYWAKAFVAQGRAALIVDSHAPRGLTGYDVVPYVCTAVTLRGPERAGDAAVALDALARNPVIDAADILLFGASHGGWTAMELVALTGSDGSFPGLAGSPEPAPALRAHISALVLLYPYCGLLNGAEAEAWKGAPPTLMILAEEDYVISTPTCLRRAEALRTSGATVVTEILPDAGHAFDQQERSPLSPLDFDPVLREQARATAFSWLATTLR